MFGEIRDQNILQLITDNLNQGKRVMVVYGGGHYIAEKEVLDKMLGQVKLSSNSRLSNNPSICTCLC